MVKTAWPPFEAGASRIDVTKLEFGNEIDAIENQARVWEQNLMEGNEKKTWLENRMWIGFRREPTMLRHRFIQKVKPCLLCYLNSSQHLSAVTQD